MAALSGTPPIQGMTAADVRAWRRARRLSKAGMARMLGMTSRNISMWEQGVRPLPWWLRAVLHYLDCQMVIDHS